MNKLSYLMGIIILVLLVGCQDSEEEPKQHREANGGIQYGGVFHINEVENFRSLFPHDAGDISSYNIGSQVYEGLVRLDPKNLEVIPGIATSWEVSDDGLTYTFHIREGIYFHDNPCFDKGIGRELDVDDVIYSLTMLCTKSPMNDYFTMVIDRIDGAREYYEFSDSNQKLEEISGLKRIDDHTLQIKLTKPFTGMTKVLATASCWVFPKEAYDMYGEEMRVNCVGTGPFRVVKIVDNEVVILGKNKNYWRKDEFGNQLPYLDALKYTFVKEKKSELLEFKKGNLDMVYQIPSDEIEEFEIDVKKDRADFIVNDFRVQITPSLSVQYYSFQHMGEIFDDVNIRKAFNYAIDKERIVNYGLNGLGVAANYGIVPPSIMNYPCTKIDGYEYSPELARSFLAEAGFPGGKGFPRLVLEINSGGGFENIAVAEIVQKMLSDNLGINVDLSVTNRIQHMDRVGSGKSDFWREAWLADYSDPENFLCLFYGPYAPTDRNESSFINSTRYKNKSFDVLYENANIEQNEAKRMELFCKADQKVIEDAAVIPLYYEKSVRLLKLYVKNFPLNPMEYRDFGTVYFDFQQNDSSLTAAQ